MKRYSGKPQGSERERQIISDRPKDLGCADRCALPRTRVGCAGRDGTDVSINADQVPFAKDARVYTAVNTRSWGGSFASLSTDAACFEMASSFAVVVRMRSRTSSLEAASLCSCGRPADGLVSFLHVRRSQPRVTTPREHQVRVHVVARGNPRD